LKNAHALERPQMRGGQQDAAPPVQPSIKRPAYIAFQEPPKAIKAVKWAEQSSPPVLNAKRQTTHGPTAPHCHTRHHPPLTATIHQPVHGLACPQYGTYIHNHKNVFGQRALNTTRWMAARAALIGSTTPSDSSATTTHLLMPEPVADAVSGEDTSDVEEREIAAVATKPKWFTPLRLLIIFCLANIMVYLDRGAMLW